jgi:hypothetical protein
MVVEAFEQNKAEHQKKAIQAAMESEAAAAAKAKANANANANAKATANEPPKPEPMAPAKDNRFGSEITASQERNMMKALEQSKKAKVKMKDKQKDNLLASSPIRAKTAKPKDTTIPRNKSTTNQSTPLDNSAASKVTTKAKLHPSMSISSMTWTPQLTSNHRQPITNPPRLVSDSSNTKPKPGKRQTWR